MAGHRRQPIRLWLIGVVCLAAGATATIVFWANVSPSDSAGTAVEAGFVLIWYALGLLLLAIDLRRFDRSSPWPAMGWTIWFFGAVCCCGSVVRFLPE